jgi:hypothetical protein
VKRHKLFLVLAAGGSAIALLVFPATLSAANGGPTRIAITDAQQAFDAPAGVWCRFELDVTPVVNNQYLTIYPAAANGDVRETIDGLLKDRFTNVGTGKSIVANVSGPSTEIVHADGSADLTLDGSAAVAYTAPFNPRGPDTVIYTGHTVFSVDEDSTLTLLRTTDKNPFDVCAELS